MRRDLKHLLFTPASESYSESCWCPAVDIYRSSRGWLVKFDLAGVRPEDVQLSVEGRRLVLRGIRHDLSVVEGQQAYTMEISYNRFERSVELPCELEGMVIQRTYQDGMFLVTIVREASL